MLKTGRVILDNRLTIDCVIRDMSAGGARLVFGAPPTLTGTLELLIPSAQIAIPMAVAWQRGLAIGAQFTGPQRSTA